MANIILNQCYNYYFHSIKVIDNFKRNFKLFDYFIPFVFVLKQDDVIYLIFYYFIQVEFFILILSSFLYFELIIFLMNNFSEYH